MLKRFALTAALLFAGMAAAQVAGPTPHQVTLTWDPWTQGSGGVGTGFKIYRKTGSAQYAPIATLPATTFAIYLDTESATNPLAESTTFFYVVTTTGLGGSESAPSNETSATIPKRASPVTNLQSTAK